MSLAEYKGDLVKIPGRKDLPAHMPPQEQHTEKKYLDALLADLNSNLLVGLDKEPNLSRSSKKPEMYLGFREGTVDSGIFFGGSNASKLSASASTLGLDAYRMATGG